ncbi:hypothetical protein ACFQXB_02315 [Plastorhodobacter daqingensis]|uniref:Sulfotransferase family protein n=1 Tax=Plastorhodobacter daqingensis TaxID=1387281 RepID=A0ABW2UED1_9RHOB
MIRVIVHAGFHKTGTSSLQLYFETHRRALGPWLSYYGKADFPLAGTLARTYAERPFAWRRRAFRHAFRQFLAPIPAAPMIVLSRETFAGVMPGHRNWLGRTVKGYAYSAVPICGEIRTELMRRFGPDTQVEFLLTTRERESWIRSVYGHLLRSIHLTEDYEAFRARLPATLDLQHEAAEIARQLSPVRVHVAALEDYGTCREGPAAALLDLAGVPLDLRNRLPPARRANSGQSPELMAAFLRMNREGHPKQDLKRRKDRMINERAS